MSLSLRYDYWQHSVVICTVGAAMLMCGLFLLVGYNATLLLHTVGSQLKIIVFLDDHIQPGQRQVIERQLRALPGVQAVAYVSKDQARRDFTSWFRQGETLLAELPENPLPASYAATFHPSGQDAAAVKTLVRSLSRLPGVTEVQYNARLLQEFYTALKLVRTFSLASGVLLIGSVICIITNTMRLLIHIHRQEIEILHLVGATTGFIKGPFLLTGVLQSTVGTLLALAVLYGLYQCLGPWTRTVSMAAFGLQHTAFLPRFLVGGMVAGGAFLGYIGSIVPLWRVLRSITR